MAVEKNAKLDQALINERKEIEQAAEKGGTDAMAPFENDVDGELLEILCAQAHLTSTDCFGAVIICQSNHRFCSTRFGAS